MKDDAFRSLSFILLPSALLLASFACFDRVFGAGPQRRVRLDRGQALAHEPAGDAGHTAAC